MSKVRQALFLAVACAVMFPAAAAEDAARHTKAPALETGTLGEAPYRIDIPDHWNGELVVLARGFEPVGAPRTSPMSPNEATPVFLAAGYAVAQSGYSTQGWAVRDALADLERLRQHFVQQHGAARRTYLVGFSMGGGIAIASLEKHANAYDGALSLCGANVPGTRMAEALFTTLVAFDYFFPSVPDIAGGLAKPQASAANQGQIMAAIGAALAGHPQHAAQLAKYLDVPADAVAGVVSIHYLVFQDMAQRAGGLPVDNRKTVYRGLGDDKAFNAGVQRYAGDAKAMQYIATAPALSGQLDKPLVLQYNHGDPTITPRFRSIFADLSKTSGKAKPVLLPPVGEGHCGFSSEQIGSAFTTLVEWVGSGKRPVSQ